MPKRSQCAICNKTIRWRNAVHEACADEANYTPDDSRRISIVKLQYVDNYAATRPSGYRRGRESAILDLGEQEAKLREAERRKMDERAYESKYGLPRASRNPDIAKIIESFEWSKIMMLPVASRISSLFDLLGNHIRDDLKSDSMMMSVAELILVDKVNHFFGNITSGKKHAFNITDTEFKPGETCYEAVVVCFRFDPVKTVLVPIDDPAYCFNEKGRLGKKLSMKQSDTPSTCNCWKLRTLLLCTIRDQKAKSARTARLPLSTSARSCGSSADASSTAPSLQTTHP